MRRSWEWFKGKAHSKHVRTWLAIISFCEASFFPIITDVFLIPVLAARTGRWTYYAFLVSVASVLGAVFGYALGMFVFEPVVQPLLTLYGFTDEFAHVGVLYSESTFWTVFAAAFTPIPFKVFVLAGGFFSVPFIPFLLASVVGRSARFFLVSFLSHKYGPKVAEKFIQYFNHITVVFVVLLSVFAFFYFL